MCDMTVNLRELHRRTGAVVERVARGEVIVIEKRGKVVAEISPAANVSPGFPATHWKAVESMPRFSDDSGQFISESRDRG
jgi:prevent-host-death family protein